jgi:TRAP-type C4-dicarboxylate transport system permease small subunit
MKWKNFRRQLAAEVRDYLAALRELRDNFRYLEGWITLALLAATVLMLVAWAISSLGFNPPSDDVAQVMYRFGLRSCRSISNFSGVIVIVDAMLLVFLIALTLGSVLNQMERVKQGLPRNPGELIFLTVLMLVVGVGGIVYMRWIC